MRWGLAAQQNHLLMRRIFVALASALLLWGGVAGVAGRAGAGAWPGCPPDHPAGPCHWCPGDPPVQTGNLRVNPVIWDTHVCHTYWYVLSDQGNVAKGIFEGDVPPAPPPPPPGLNFCPIPPWCP
jgi:hypothetical protein